MKSTYDQLSQICSKATTRLYSTSFSLGILFLSKEVRQPIYDIYGFVRLADEIVDSFHEFEKTELLAEFKLDCFSAIKRGISLNPILNAFQIVVNKFYIDHELIEAFLKSMEMDLSDQHYTKRKYEQYIFGSAQVVGLMCLRVFTSGTAKEYERLKYPAMKLGSAFQKINFLRDVKADYFTLNRSYFPGLNLSAFDDESKRLIEQDIKCDFEEALKGIQQLPKSCQRGVYLAYLYYTRLLTKISKLTAQQMMSERIRVANWQKLLLVFYSYYGPWLKQLHYRGH
ncbi:phytoene/squalene synthase family protein [Pedobacter frigidisoli]|uniref:phytoene/squalene synthase family protein n=1 Tax=Pedobacter frigidisoli TaxID=2530455 RepID=UPI00292D7656|nr:phytoene/squalene synthase family protein [Pedobacter frigidisoli]